MNNKEVIEDEQINFQWGCSSPEEEELFEEFVRSDLKKAQRLLHRIQIKYGGDAGLRAQSGKFACLYKAAPFHQSSIADSALYDRIFKKLRLMDTKESFKMIGSFDIQIAKWVAIEVGVGFNMQVYRTASEVITDNSFGALVTLLMNFWDDGDKLPFLDCFVCLKTYYTAEASGVAKTSEAETAFQGSSSTSSSESSSSESSSSESSSSIRESIHFMILAKNEDDVLPQKDEKEADWMIRIQQLLNPSQPEIPTAVSFIKQFDDPMDLVEAFSHYTKKVHHDFNSISAVGSVPFLAPLFMVAQSSGWGKTRLIYELRNYAPVIYLNLRPAASLSLPPRTAAVADHIAKLTTQEQFEMLLLRILLVYCRVLFASRFTYLTDKNARARLMECTFNSKPMLISDNQRDQPLFSGSEHFWNAVISSTTGSSSSSTGGDVINPMEALVPQLGGYAKAADGSFCPEVNGIVNALTGKPSNQLQLLTLWESLLDLIALKERAETALKLTTCFPLVLAIDEAASQLLIQPQVPEQSSRQEEKTLFQMLRKAVEQFGKYITVIVVDTNMKLLNFAPIFHRDPSQRVLNQNRRLFHPFYHFPMLPGLRLEEELARFRVRVECDGRGFNSSSSDGGGGDSSSDGGGDSSSDGGGDSSSDGGGGDSSSDGGLVASLLYNPFDAVLRSRPLFHGLIPIQRNLGKSPQQIWQFLEELSTEKLTFGQLDSQVRSSNSGILKDASTVAFFAARLSIVPLAGDLKEEMVAKNMATLLYMDEHRQRPHVVFAPEPMVALGAARLMNNEVIFDEQLKELLRLISLGRVGSMISQGDFGEFAASVLMMRAFDKAHSSCSGSPPSASAVSAAETSTREPCPDISAAYETVVERPPAADTSSTVATNAAGSAIGTSATAASDIAAAVSTPVMIPDASAPVTLLAFFKQLFAASFAQQFEKIATMPTVSSECASAAVPMMLRYGWMRSLQRTAFVSKIQSKNMIAHCYRIQNAIATTQMEEGCDHIDPVMIAMPESVREAAATAVTAALPVSATGATSNWLTEESTFMTALFTEVKWRKDNFYDKDLSRIVEGLHNKARALVPTGPVVLMVLQLGNGFISRLKRKKKRVEVLLLDSKSGFPRANGNALVDDDALLVIAQTLDKKTFGKCVSSATMLRLQDLQSRQQQWLEEVQLSMPMLGFEKRREKMEKLLEYQMQFTLFMGNKHLPKEVADDAAAAAGDTDDAAVAGGETDDAAAAAGDTDNAAAGGDTDDAAAATGDTDDAAAGDTDDAAAAGDTDDAAAGGGDTDALPRKRKFN